MIADRLITMCRHAATSHGIIQGIGKGKNIYINKACVCLIKKREREEKNIRAVGFGEHSNPVRVDDVLNESGSGSGSFSSGKGISRIKGGESDHRQNQSQLKMKSPHHRRRRHHHPPPKLHTILRHSKSPYIS